MNAFSLWKKCGTSYPAFRPKLRPWAPWDRPGYVRTISPAVAKLADRTGCQWRSKSSKVDYFISSERAYATFY